MNLQAQADLINSQHPWVKYQWDTTSENFDLWSFRYLVACIIVGGSSEASVLNLAPELFKKYPTVKDFAKAEFRSLVDLLAENNIQYEGRKGKCLIETATILLAQHNGKVPNNRKQLEELPGVGRHVASVILATVFDQNEFAVDLHVRRIMERWGYKGTDLALEKIVAANVKPEMWGHFSRAFVDFGQARCGFHSKCNGCPITECPSRKEKAVKAVKPDTVKAEASYEGYRIERTANGLEFQAPGSEFVVTVKSNGTCNCKGFRFRRTCKHVEYVG